MTGIKEAIQRTERLQNASQECFAPMVCVILECKCGASISTSGYELAAAKGFIGQLGFSKGWDIVNGEPKCVDCQ